MIPAAALRRRALAGSLLGLLLLGAGPTGRTAEPSPPPAAATNWLDELLQWTETSAAGPLPRRGYALAFKEGRVTVILRDTAKEQDARAGQALGVEDELRTPPQGRALVLEASQAAAIAGGSKVLVDRAERLFLKEGQLFIKSLGTGQPQRLWVSTPAGQAVAHGTEFQLEVDPDTGETRLWVGDGQITLTNEWGSTNLVSQGADAVSGLGTALGLMRPNAAPWVETAKVEAFNHIIQWMLYYPAVLELEDLPADLAGEAALRTSLAAYRKGDLVAAREAYDFRRQPDLNTPAGQAEALYRIALLLTSGRITEADEALKPLEVAGDASLTRRIAAAYRRLIAAVTRQPAPTGPAPELATEFLAESYYAQSLTESGDNLGEALSAASRAAVLRPESGFAWSRVAELEFGHGRIRRARVALASAERLTPDNPQVPTLKGFLLAAEGRLRPALDSFQRAVTQDPRLGDAWLGLGLCLIRQGDTQAGLRCIQVAVAREPQRAMLKSYLGKAYDAAGLPERALAELRIAARTDPRDPTPWLYSALINLTRNRINEAVADLEHSKALNDNRLLLRSRSLTDQDLAVRSANLAAIYKDAGLAEVSVDEAMRALNADYANFAAHLFLANSYNELRDPNQVNLRYETAMFSQYLMAVLLSPVGGARLSPQVSANEYSRLFDRTGLGLNSQTSFSTHGDISESASQYGTFGGTEYSVDAAVRSLSGYAPNTDLRQVGVAAQVKQQLSLQDVVYVQAVYNQLESGDVRQLYDPNAALATLQAQERQDPNLFAGYRHEWQPGVVTLALFGRLSDTLQLSDPVPRDGYLVLTQPFGGRVTEVGLGAASFDWSNDFVAYSGEVQQLWQTGPQQLVGGVRYQSGSGTADSTLLAAGDLADYGVTTVAQALQTRMQRFSGYAYDTVTIVDPLQVTAGLTYDWLSYPQNYNSPPLAAGQQEKNLLSPKFGVQWTPWTSTLLRGAYTRSLGGVFYDNSVRLEPTVVGGFNQAFRSLIPESVAGSIPGTTFNTAGLSLSQRLPTRTYLGVAGEWLASSAQRQQGVFVIDELPPVPSQTPQDLDYEEWALRGYVSQLIGDEWSVGARYQASFVTLDKSYSDISPSIWSGARSQEKAVLQQMSLFALLNLPCGAFSQLECLFLAQDNQSNQPPASGYADESFWQMNFLVGYRFPRRVAQVTLGLLNLTDTDYRLNPLSAYPQLPRERTLAVNLEITF